MSKATRRVEGFTCRAQRVEGDMYNSTCRLYQRHAEETAADFVY